MRRIHVAVVIWLSVLFAPLYGKCGTTVVLLRHAEKATSPTNDPPLSATGESRANVLADVLADAGVSAIFITEYQRTRQTAAPLAAQLHVNPQVIPASNSHELVEVIRNIHEGVVVVVGHSNTIPTIIAGLGGPSVMISDNEFDNLFILTIGPSGTSFVRLHYGSSSTSAKAPAEKQEHAMQLKFSRSGGFAGTATNVEGVVTFHDGTAEVNSSNGYQRSLNPAEVHSLKQSMDLKYLRGLGAPRTDLRDAYQYDVVIDLDNKKRESFSFHDEAADGKTNNLLQWIAEECRKIWEYRTKQ